MFHELTCNVSLKNLVDMTKLILSFIILSIIGFAVAQQTVVRTVYSDASCATPSPTPQQGVANPLSIPVNSCVLWVNLPGNLQYMKFAPCKSSSEGTGYGIFTDKAVCEAATAASLTAQVVMGSCTPDATSGSSKYTCSSASTISFSLLFAVAPLLAFCL
jgi:hypothetical protein